VAPDDIETSSLAFSQILGGLTGGNYREIADAMPEKSSLLAAGSRRAVRNARFSDFLLWRDLISPINCCLRSSSHFFVTA
jgi:hypothetical protein